MTFLLAGPQFLNLISIPQEFIDDGEGNVKGVRTVEVLWTKDSAGRWKMDEVEGTEKVICSRKIYLNNILIHFQRVTSYLMCI